jgi:hypothetical protein
MSFHGNCRFCGSLMGFYGDCVVSKGIEISVVTKGSNNISVFL